MKIAYLCLAHNNFEYISKLGDFLTSSGDDFFLHIDQSANIPKIISDNENINLIPNELRKKSRWGTFEICEATINLLKYARDKGGYKRYTLISGYDFPLIPANEIKEKLDNDQNYIAIWTLNDGLDNEFSKFHYYHSKLTNPGEAHKSGSRFRINLSRSVNFFLSYLFPNNVRTLNCYAKGSQWFSITDEFLDYLLDMCKDERIFNSFRYMHAPDEKFIQSIYVNSRFYNGLKVLQSDFLQGIHYIDWLGKRNKPQVFDFKNYNQAKFEKALFARKISDKIVNAVSEGKTIHELLRFKQ